MPPRKSDSGRKSDAAAVVDTANTSTAADQANGSTIHAAAVADTSSTEPAATSTGKKDKDKDHDKTTIEDLTLPRSIITRLAKGMLPPNTQVQANAILAMSKSTTVFINYLAAHANEITMNANKKTIAPADVFKALDEIEFGFLKEPLEAEFAKFNAVQTEKRNSYRAKVKKPADAAAGVSTTPSKHGADDTDMTGSSALRADSTAVTESMTTPPAKKARVDTAAAADETEEEDAEDAEDDDEDAHEDDDDEVEEEEEDEEEEEGRESGDETQDALEERASRDQVEAEADEALDGDESD